MQDQGQLNQLLRKTFSGQTRVDGNRGGQQASHWGVGSQRSEGRSALQTFLEHGYLKGLLEERRLQWAAPFPGLPGARGNRVPEGREMTGKKAEGRDRGCGRQQERGRRCLACSSRGLVRAFAWLKRMLMKRGAQRGWGAARTGLDATASAPICLSVSSL